MASYTKADVDALAQVLLNWDTDTRNGGEPRRELSEVQRAQAGLCRSMARAVLDAGYRKQD